MPHVQLPRLLGVELPLLLGVSVQLPLLQLEPLLLLVLRVQLLLLLLLQFGQLRLLFPLVPYRLQGLRGLRDSVHVSLGQHLGCRRIGL